MKRPLLLAIAAAVFGGGLALGAIVIDMVMSDEGPPVLPAVVSDEVPAVVVDPPATGGGTEVLAAEGFDSPAPGAAVVPISDDTPGGAAPGLDPAEEEDGTPYPWLIEPRDLAPPAPAVPFYGSAESSRFIDLCADAPSLGLCPVGVGGTILPLDGDLTVGDFDLFVLSDAPTEWWQCFPSPLVEGDVPLLLAATHPARMEIEYYPVGEPELARSVVVDLTDPTGTTMRDFLAAVEAAGAPPFDGVHHCFALEPSRGGVVVGDALPAVNRLRYRVEVTATSFTGATDTLSEVVEYPLTRPPVTVDPVTPYELRIGVPVKSDPVMHSVVYFKYLNDGVHCADVEDAMLAGELDGAVAGPGIGHRGARVSRTIVGGAVDPSYDLYDIWSVSLEESTEYEMCVWWIRSPERSFDPAHLLVAERETRVVVSPDMLRTVISAYLVTAAEEGPPLDPGAYRVISPFACGGQSTELPLEFTEAGLGLFIEDPVVLCEYPGTAQPDETSLQVVMPDGSVRTFLVPTPATRLPVNQRLELNLSTTARLCGTGLGASCPSPFGPKIFLEVYQVPGPSNGLGDWLIGPAAVAAAPDRPPDELAEGTRIDSYNSRVETVDRHSIAVNAFFDRPVSLVASVEGDACLTAGEGTSAAPALAAEHHIVIDGLCPLSEYDVKLEVTDASGNPAVFSTLDSDWFGHGSTDGYHVTFQLAIEDVESGSPTRWSEVFVARWYAEVGGEDVPLGAPSRCFAYTVSAPQPGVWGEEVVLDVLVRIYRSDFPDERGYCSVEDTDRAAYEEAVGRVEATFSIDDFRDGSVEVVFGNFRQVHPVVREFFRFGIAAVITGTIEE